MSIIRCNGGILLSNICVILMYCHITNSWIKCNICCTIFLCFINCWYILMSIIRFYGGILFRTICVILMCSYIKTRWITNSLVKCNIYCTIFLCFINCWYILMSIIRCYGGILLRAICVILMCSYIKTRLITNSLV